MKKYYYYISTFIISLFSLLFFSFDSYAAYDADSEQTLLYTGANYNNTQNLSYTLNFRTYEDFYSFDGLIGSDQVVISGTEMSLDGFYQIFHVRQEFQPINYIGVNNLNYDGFASTSTDTSRAITVTSSNSNFAQIFNIKKSIEYNFGGHILSTDLQYPNVYYDSNLYNQCNLTPVVEYDLYISLTDYSSNYTNTVSVTINSSYSSQGSDLLFYGVNYVSSGEKSILNALNNLLNGYSGDITEEANNNFNDSASELESIESDLAGTSNNNIISYTDTFDTSIIGSLGSSLVYVVTWFSNFWNLGGLFTNLLSVSMAIYVAFFIIFRRG